MHTTYHQADSVRIDSDEDGFHLIIESDEGTFDFNISGTAEDLYDSVKAEIGPWLQEREEAREEFKREGRAMVREFFACDPDESGGYDIGDPKHPDFHSVHADIYDQRAGK